MDWRRLLTALGTGATTFLLVGALVASLVPDIPGGIIGVFAGAVTGIVVTVGGWVGLGRVDAPVTSAVLGYAVFGYVFLAIAFLEYAHVAGLGSAVSFRLQLGISIALAMLVAVGDWSRSVEPVPPGSGPE